MVLMPKRACRHGLKLHVVLPVRRGHDHRGWPGKFEKDSLECTKTRRIEVFDNFHDSSGVIAAEAGITIHQRTLQELDTLALARRNVDSHDFAERGIS